MKSVIAKTFFVIPVVYIAVIFLLVFLQFYAGQSFQEARNGLRLSGRYDATSDEDARRLSEVTVAYQGLEFVFDHNMHPSLKGDDDTVTLQPVGYTALDSGFELHFRHDVSLRFRVPDEGGLMIQAFLPEAVRPMNALMVPYRLAAGANAERVGVDGEILITHNNEVYTLTAPPRAEVDISGQSLSLRGDVDFQTIRYRRTGTLQDHVVERRFADGRNAISAAEINAKIGTYIDNAYEAWSGSRFNGGSGTWEMRSGSPQFEEEILVAYLAEAWYRNEFTGAFNQMRRAADQHPRQVGLLSAPFLGNLNQIRPQFLEQDEAATAELLALVTDGNPEVFRKPRLFQFARNRGSAELYEALLAYTERVDIHTLSLEDAVGLYRLHLEAEYLTAEEERLLGRFYAIAEERLYPAIVEAEEGFFLETAPGQVDIALSALAGRQLERAGGEVGDEIMVHVGRQLIHSVLQLADDEGFLPRVVHPGDTRLEGSEGSIGAEALYNALSDNPAYPRPVSLSETGASGNAWMLTIAEPVETEITDTRARVRIRYPRNQTHYIIMQNIPAFERMELFGQTWRNDRAFENYIKGRNYVAQSETLLIKYNDDSTEGDIILFY